MKIPLSAQLLTYDFKKLFEKKGYAWFTKGNYNLNIIGVRTNHNNKVTNMFDDFLVVDFNTDNGHRRYVYPITTEPGIYYMKDPMNSKGAAILVPGQYRSTWVLGLHRGKYTALVQNKNVKVYRDNNKNDVYDLEPKTIDTGHFGINIHKANANFTRNTVDQYSAGCQVFNNPEEFKSFIIICKQQAAKYGNSFTYTLVNESDL